MTKVYLVRTVRMYENGNIQNYVEKVFTNKKLAEKCAAWLNKADCSFFEMNKQTPIMVTVYFEAKYICHLDYSKLPF